ncbi:hypothetical protein [Saccharopolyspora mangrovi]|uniref:Uncharacterized protein n=1 Tax=Saccharopolyspora mangrovi TaxID=3082379 RepID=A0ABU6A752_9PSEU|nr:hypothetical protein [Saccharopolyspora sp. S2-29]MEB3367388.1 hypothetical protein [Saccharopolyspora sp. S2-29]
MRVRIQVEFEGYEYEFERERLLESTDVKVNRLQARMLVNEVVEDIKAALRNER